MIWSWTSPVAVTVGITFQHHCVCRVKVRVLVANSPLARVLVSQDMKLVNSAFLLISVRDWDVEAPQCLHRHRVRPAVV